MDFKTLKPAYKLHFKSVYFFGLLTTKRSSIIYNFYGLSVFLLFVNLFAFSLIKDFLSAKDFQELTFKSSLTIEMILFQCKLVNFYFQQKKFLEIVKSFDELEINDVDNILKETDKSISRIVSFYCCVCVSAGVTQILMTILFGGHNELSVPFFMDLSEYDNLYIPTMAYQAIQIVILAFMSGIMGTFPVVFMRILEAHLVCLGRKLKGVGGNGEMKPEKAVKELKEYIQYHRKLNK